MKKIGGGISTISLKPELIEKLKKLGIKGDTYSDIIEKLLVQGEKK